MEERSMPKEEKNAVGDVADVADGVDDVSQEDLEKALDTALEEMHKANKKDKVVPSDEEDDEDEEEEKEKDFGKKSAKKSKKSENEDDIDFQKLSKSLEEGVLEKEGDAQEVIDAVPFVKALMDTQEEQLSEVIKAIVYVADKVDAVNQRLDKSEKINVAEAKLLKSVSESVRQIGEAPFPRKSDIGKPFEIIKKSEDGEKKINFTKAEALEKLTILCKSDKITLEEMIMVEGRFNKGMEIPAKFQNLLTS